MLRRLLTALGGLALAAAAGTAFIAVAMRTKSPRMLRAVRVFNRSFTNKLQLKTAGSTGTKTAVIHHVGRRSGQTYQTPIVPFPTSDGFLIALPYGHDTDWLKNVLAARQATLTLDGREIAVDRPEVITTAEVSALFPESEQRTHRIFGVDQCLRVRRRPNQTD